MEEIQGNCTSCGYSTAIHKHRMVQGNFCLACFPWVKKSVLRTRKFTALREVMKFSGPEQVEDVRKRLEGLLLDLDENGDRERFPGAVRRALYYREMHGHPRHRFPDGISYGGPTNEGSWMRCLDALIDPSKNDDVFMSLPMEVIEDSIEKLKSLFVPWIPNKRVIRNKIAYLISSVYSSGVERKRFAIALAIWLLPGQEYIVRDVSPWRNSFLFLREVVEQMGNRRAWLTDEGVNVRGTSGLQYRICPKRRQPFYVVCRIHEGKKIPICIDLEQGRFSNIVFGDILVSLVLSLYNDEISSQRIHTLQRHLAAERHRLNNQNTPLMPEYGNGRRINLEVLWRRLTDVNRGDLPDLNAPNGEPMTAHNWRMVVDRFQTSLWNWDNGGEEE